MSSKVDHCIWTKSKNLEKIIAIQWISYSRLMKCFLIVLTAVLGEDNVFTGQAPESGHTLSLSRVIINTGLGEKYFGPNWTRPALSHPCQFIMTSVTSTLAHPYKHFHLILYNGCQFFLSNWCSSAIFSSRWRTVLDYELRNASWEAWNGCN